MGYKRHVEIACGGVCALVLSLSTFYLLYITRIYDSDLERCQIKKYSTDTICTVTSMLPRMEYDLLRKNNGSKFHQFIFGQDAFTVTNTGINFWDFFLGALYIAFAISTTIAAYLEDRRYLSWCLPACFFDMVYTCIRCHLLGTHEEETITAMGCFLWRLLPFTNPTKYMPYGFLLIWLGFILRVCLGLQAALLFDEIDDKNEMLTRDKSFDIPPKVKKVTPTAQSDSQDQTPAINTKLYPILEDVEVSE